MASESLGAVLLDALNQNSKTGKCVVGAYRVGGTRLIEKTLPGRLGRPGTRAAHFLVRGVAKVSDNAELVLDIVHDQTVKAVQMVTSKVGGVENPYATKYFELVSKISLPGARIARGLCTKLAAGAAGISGRAGLTVAAEPAHETAATVAAISPRKAVKRGRKIADR